MAPKHPAEMLQVLEVGLRLVAHMPEVQEPKPELPPQGQQRAEQPPSAGSCVVQPNLRSSIYSNVVTLTPQSSVYSNVGTLTPQSSLYSNVKMLR